VLAGSNASDLAVQLGDGEFPSHRDG
jgi:hypothetical protein